ncbi:peptidoglycan-binding LysM [Capnocytophaga sputigena]|uniref:peptidoglycan-binding LysM n=1 Tax=Capnocytophaga sputigena TaxID=1019 RepID=UPI0028D85A87|nr:peptidoglycan-binding LysM [Capnocytophaga sputigena]
MKKTILALMATAAIVACSKSDDKEDDHTSGKFPKKITQITGTTRVEHTFEMQDATRPKKETITTYQGSSTNGKVETHEYNYDSNNRLISKVDPTDEPSLWYLSNFSYNANGKLEKEERVFVTLPYIIKNYEYANGKLSKKVEKPASNGDGNYITTSFDYPSANVVRVTKTSYSVDKAKKGDDVNEWHVYTLGANGNVVKDEYRDATHSYEIVYEYDTKVNPEYVSFRVQSTPDHFVTLLTPNNITKKTVTATELANSTKVTKTVHRHDIQYDGDYPIQIKVYSVPEDKTAGETLVQTTEYTY